MFTSFLQAIILEPSTNYEEKALPQLVSAVFISLPTAVLERATARQKTLGCVNWIAKPTKFL